MAYYPERRSGRSATFLIPGRQTILLNRLSVAGIHDPVLLDEARSMSTMALMDESDRARRLALYARFPRKSSDDLLGCESCGCVRCLHLFQARDITYWFDSGNTPACPRCGRDAVAGSTKDTLLDELILRQMARDGFGVGEGRRSPLPESTEEDDLAREDRELLYKCLPHTEEQLKACELVGCYWCTEIYPPSEIKCWISGRHPAICPRCGIDSVMGGSSEQPLSREFLDRRHRDTWY